MMKQTVQGMRGSIVPIGVLLFLGLLLMSIHTHFETYAAVAAAAFCVLYAAVVFVIVRYRITAVEYVVSDTAFVLRRIVCGRVVSAETIPFSVMTAVGFGKRLQNRGKKIPCTNFCATFCGQYGRHLLLFYKAEDGSERKLICEPNDAVLAALKRSTVGKFYERKVEEERSI